MTQRTNTIKGKIVRIGKNNEFHVGDNKPGAGGMHVFQSSLISDFHEDEPIEITYSPDTGKIKEMKSLESTPEKRTIKVKDIISWGGKESLPYSEDF